MRNDLLQDVYNTTLGFEQILVVNLPQRTDRRDALSLAASFSNIKLDWIPGVKGSEVLDLTMPLDKGFAPPKEATKGSWRAHLNAIHTIIDRNLSSALIMEDDMDWDLRIKDQLRDFALSSRALIQPLFSNPSAYRDPSFPNPAAEKSITNIPFSFLPDTIPPTFSPYGDDWDVLWLGHCGMYIPNESTDSHSKGRVVHENDKTVPIRGKLHKKYGPPTLQDEYPDHTRIVHHAHAPICSTAYAVSLRGARKILYELSINRYDTEYDNMVRGLCDGVRETKLMCLTVQPALFKHWRPRGSMKYQSDISENEDEWREQGRSWNIRWSVHMNFGRLVMGERGGWVDQWPDE
ncbi:glycosyltransferase family 25 protein [Delitschia confertaspora ATCC 74209]|uniref:Glycosyltransferase family 25 protein n=1 Tax=Delitschia confertaspora ATCC 74209 TaxID=1513339 RepID=A0A9P4JUR8_9PLEO|nr:glycosyltransferase family 25 protein [Delitschia confertaspora ATCC 74209]